MGIERSYKIVQNRGKRFNKIDLPSHLLCITCVSTAFRGVSKRFQWVLGSTCGQTSTSGGSRGMKQPKKCAKSTNKTAKEGLSPYEMEELLSYGEENREPKTHWNRFETPPNAVETQVIHRSWEGKSILLNLFPLF